LFYNTKNGEVEDWTGNGLEDLQTMRLRPPERPYDRYSAGEYNAEGVPLGLKPKEWTMYEVFRVLKTEDPLRVLRILRFHARYPTSTIDAPVIRAMEDPELQRRIVDRIHDPNAQTALAQERVSGELRAMMSAADPAKAVRIMADTGLLEAMITPPNHGGKYEPLTMDQRSKYHDQNLVDHTVSVLRQTNKLCKDGIPEAGIPPLSDKNRMLMNFGALFHDVGKRDTSIHKPGKEDQIHYPGHELSSKKQWEYFARAAKFSVDEMKFISQIAENHMIPHTHVDEKTLQPKVDDSTLREFVHKHNSMWKYYYLHAMADAMSKSDEPDESRLPPYHQVMQRIPSVHGLQTDESGEMILPDLVNGHEIQQIVRQPPGPIIGRILREVRQMQYKNFGHKERLSYDQLRQLAIDYIKKRYRQLPIDGSVIIQTVGWPPQTGYVEVVKNRLRTEQDRNPELTAEQAKQIVQQMMANHELDAYAPKQASVRLVFGDL
jgi:putative nucleotidyltransferase with HDIG domain